MGRKWSFNGESRSDAVKQAMAMVAIIKDFWKPGAEPQIVVTYKPPRKRRFTDPHQPVIIGWGWSLIDPTPARPGVLLMTDEPLAACGPILTHNLKDSLSPQQKATVDSLSTSAFYVADPEGLDEWPEGLRTLAERTTVLGRLVEIDVLR